MGDPKLLLIAFLVVASSTGVHGQFNFDTIKNGISGVGQDISAWGKGVGQDISGWGKGVMSSINSFKDKAMGKFKDALPDKVKGWINQGNFATANVTALLQSMPQNAWNAMKLEQVMTMGKENFTRLISEGERMNKIPKRILDEMKRLLANNKTVDEVLNDLKQQSCRMGEMGNGCAISKSTLSAYLNILGNPRNFNLWNITDMSTAIYNFPTGHLVLINDSNAIKSVIAKLQPCLEQNPPTFCPRRNTAQVAIRMLSRNAFGEPVMWTAETITAMGGAAKLSAQDIDRLPDQTLRAIKTDLTRAQFSPDDSEIVMKALVRAEGVMIMSPADVNNWINSLGNIKSFVMSDSVPQQALSDSTINATITSNINLLASNGLLPKKKSKMLLKNILAGKSVNTMTEADVNAAGILLNEASPNIIQRLVERGMVKGSTLTSLASNFKDSGPGSDIKGQLLLYALMNTTNSRAVPSSLFRFQTPSKIRSMSATDINNFLRSVGQDGLQLDDSQKAAMLAQLGTGDMLRLPPNLKGSVPTASISAFSNSQLQDFSIGLPANSPANLKLASNVFTGLRNVTLQDIQSNKKVLPVMSSFDANRVNENDIVAILTSFNMADRAPSMDVCRTLKNKMIRLAMKELDPDNAMEVAQMMTVGEAENTPPCVLAALGKNALQSLRPEVQAIIMQNMGGMDNSMSIPRSTRQIIIEAGMKPLGNIKMITGDMLNNLNNSIVDLTPEQIKMIDPNEAPNYLLQMAALFGSTNKPCLDGAQRREIAAWMERVKRRTSEWNDATDYCCLLEVLSSTQLSKIQPEVLSSCTCVSATDGFEDYIDARNNLCKSDIGFDEFNRNMRSMEDVTNRQMDAAVNSLNTVNSGRRKRATSDDTCAAASVGGAAAVSAADINNMDNVTFMACLASITQYEMDDNMARTVFVKIISAKNNLLDTLSIPEMLNVNFAWAGMRTSEVKNLTTFVYSAYNDVVSDLGIYWELRQDVVKELANKVQTQWRPASQLTSNDIIILRQLICGFNESSVNDIPSSMIKPAMTALNGLKMCPVGVTRALATKAVAAYGSVDLWDSATVSEMGNLIGGLAPEKLMAIPSTAFAGITSKGLSSIPPDSIKALKVDQIRNLPATVALSLSASQKAQFNSEMLDALKDVLSGNSGVVDMPPTMMVFLMATAMLLFK